MIGRVEHEENVHNVHGTAEKQCTKYSKICLICTTEGNKCTCTAEYVWCTQYILYVWQETTSKWLETNNLKFMNMYKLKSIVVVNSWNKYLISCGYKFS